MRITTLITWDVESGIVCEHESYEYSGPVLKLCSSGDQVASSLEQSQSAMANTLNQDYEINFGEQQQVLNNLQAKMNYEIQNPSGYTPQQLAGATTSINENTATAAKQAIGAAGAFAAAHGGADVGSGAAGEIAGQVGTAAALSKSQQLSQLAQQNQAFKQQNFWNGIQGLNSAGSEYGGAGGTAIGAASNTANSSVNAGELKLASEQAGWGDAFGVVSGIGGLATAASGFNFGGGSPAPVDIGGVGGPGGTGDIGDIGNYGV